MQATRALRIERWETCLIPFNRDERCRSPNTDKQDASLEREVLDVPRRRHVCVGVSTPCGNGLAAP